MSPSTTNNSAGRIKANSTATDPRNPILAGLDAAQIVIAV